MIVPLRVSLCLALATVTFPDSAALADPPASYHVDLARLAWATPAQELRERVTLTRTLDSLRSETRTPPRSTKQLLATLRNADRARILTAWHADYYHVRAALDTREESSGLAEDSLDTTTDEAFAALRAWLVKPGVPAMDALFRQEPGLAPYRAFVDEAREQAGHELAPGAGGLGSLATSWQFTLYQRLVDRTDFGTVRGPDGPLDVRRKRDVIAALPDSALRNQGSDMLAAGYAKQRDLYAFALLQTVRARNVVARARGYPDAPGEAYAARHLTTERVRALIAAVRPHGTLFQRYERARDRARVALGGHSPPRLSQAETAEAMRQALSPLGPEYARELEALLDPASRRLELGPGEHRQGGGFSFVLPGGQHGVYLDGFGGLPGQVSRLVHESGHAMHYRMFERGGAPGVYGPAFGEAVAQFGEVVVMDQLAGAASDPADALYWQQQFLLKALELFLGAKDAELEQTIYDSTAAGRVGSADDLDRITANVDSAYSSDRRPGTEGRWMRASLLVEDPLYLSNYLYSGCLILALYRQYTADPAGFVPRYLAFMHQPSAEPPEPMLRRTLGISLDDPALLREGLQLLEARIARFERDVASLGTR